MKTLSFEEYSALMHEKKEMISKTQFFVCLDDAFIKVNEVGGRKGFADLLSKQDFVALADFIFTFTREPNNLYALTSMTKEEFRQSIIKNIEILNSFDAARKDARDKTLDMFWNPETKTSPILDKIRIVTTTDKTKDIKGCLEEIAIPNSVIVTSTRRAEDLELVEFAQKNGSLVFPFSNKRRSPISEKFNGDRKAKLEKNICYSIPEFVSRLNEMFENKVIEESKEIKNLSSEDEQLTFFKN